MTDFISGIGDAIGQAFAAIGDAIGNVISSIVRTADQWVPGGFAVFVVLVVIAILVGLATLRR
jgi:hypothetical protein